MSASSSVTRGYDAADQRPVVAVDLGTVGSAFGIVRQRVLNTKAGLDLKDLVRYVPLGSCVDGQYPKGVSAIELKIGKQHLAPVVNEAALRVASNFEAVHLGQEAMAMCGGDDGNSM